MARTITEIREQITSTFVNNMAAAGYVVDTTTWSATNVVRALIYTVAFCIFTLESLFDLHVTSVNDALENKKPHTTRWYSKTALAFQYGFSLLPDSDQFNNEGKTESEILASKIVKYAAVIEQLDAYNRLYLRMKIAMESGTDLAPLASEQVFAFAEYMARVKDAGVKLQIDSLPADKLKQVCRCYYDPLILSSTGARLDGQDAAPVVNACKEYLKNLPFNGVYVVQYHIDYLQAVPGVVIFEIDTCEVKYGERPFEPVHTLYTPDAGYLRYENDAALTIEFIPQSPIR